MSKQVKMGELDLGEEVRFGGMIWIIKRKSQEHEYVTLALKESIKNMEFDAAEPGNPDEWVSDYGNNIYRFSNIRQWLNRDGDNWFQVTHNYDAQPSYAGTKGFLTQFSDKELKRIEKKCIKEAFAKDYFYLPSEDEAHLVTGEEFDKNWVWTSSPNSGSSYSARFVNSSGALGSGGAYGGLFGVRPLCDLKSETKVIKANGAWEIGKRKKKKKTTENKRSKHNDILTGAILKYGFESQTMMAIEEMSELTKEICKTKRGQFEKEHILEEMADVQIMLWQLGIIFGDLGEWINKKMKRLEEMANE